MMKKSKRLQKRDEGLDLIRPYALEEALTLLKERASAKFDETVEVSFNCNIDPRKGDQNIRGVVDLPQGTGKKVRVAVFAEGDAAKKALEAGADKVGSDDLMAEASSGSFDFDVCIATPDMMPRLSKLGRVLGPKGLMPNPKLGTVTDDVSSAVKASKGGRISIRPDKEGVIHAIIGKASFSMESLAENFRVLHESLLRMRPSGLKGVLLKSTYVSSTMGFGILLNPFSEKGLAFSPKE
jgi:large subunit ribosomal protein L1